MTTMETRAIVRGVRLSADKGRLVADMIRGKKVDQAINILTFTRQKKAAGIVKKALESAIANAEHNDGADIDELKVTVDLRRAGCHAEAFLRTRQGRGKPHQQADLPHLRHRRQRGHHGTKIHPVGFSSAGHAQLGLALVVEPELRRHAGRRPKVRDFLKTRLKSAAVSRILIERPAKNARITIYSARPGVVIGKKGEDIENLKAELTRRLGVPVAGEHRGGAQARDRCAADRRLDHPAAREAHHVPPRDEARDAERDAPGRGASRSCPRAA